jgi:putative transposase
MAVSIRRVCAILGLRRSSLYYQHKRKNEDQEIADLLHLKASEKPNWGFLLLFHWCRNQGKTWNKKRVYRVYKAEKLNLRKPKARKKIKRVAINPLPAEQINEGWSMDFLSDTLLSDEKKVRVLNVLDECSRMVLLSFAAKSISAKKLVSLLDELVKEKGKPSYVRCDNGPEFISKELAKFAHDNGIEIRFSQPGKPTQNGLVERLNGTQRGECLNLKYFKTVKDVQQDLDIWWNSYNFDRPHSSLGYMTPKQFIDNNQNLYFNSVAA